MYATHPIRESVFLSRGFSLNKRSHLRSLEKYIIPTENKEGREAPTRERRNCGRLGERLAAPKSCCCCCCCFSPELVFSVYTRIHTHRRARVRGVMGLRQPRSLGYTRRLIYEVTKRAVMLQTPTRWFYRSIDRTVELALSYSPIGTRTEVYKKKNIAFYY